MSVDELAGRHKKYLRGLAHGQKPLVHVGRGGVSEALVASLEAAIDHHELVKVRFLDHKDEKKTIAAELAARVDASVAGMVGHVAILYRPARDPDRRRIRLPE